MTITTGRPTAAEPAEPIQSTGRAEPGPTADPLVTAIERAEAAAADSDYTGALAVLQQAVAGGAPLTGSGTGQRFVFLLSRLLRALSRYDAARDVLQLVHHNASTASRAAAEEAEIAWIQHDYGRGIELATYALRAHLGNRKAETVLRRCQDPTTPERDAAPTGGVGHVAFYVSEGGNFGDVALPVAVRESIEAVGGPVEWLPVHAHQVLDAERLDLINRQRAVVVGGGGLFLPDTSPNANSGWQWNVPEEMLRRIEVPLSVYAVGYNLFAGQTFHGDLFRRNLVALAEQAVLIGLRNTGSLKAVRSLLPDRLHDRLRFVPCPTTILQHIHPGLPPARSGTGVVLLNAAYDRAERRFGAGYDEFLLQMRQFVAAVRAAGAELRFAAHLPADERLVRDLADRFGIVLPVEPLYNLTLEQGYTVYRAASVVIGMRGHASMIPFGLGTPVLSIVSHPKLRYFCEDIGRPDWAFDVDDPSLGAALGERVADILAGEDAYRADIAGLQQVLREHIDRAARDAVPFG